MSVIEWAWLIFNGGALILTVWALMDALQNRAAVQALNGKARELVVNGNVRREVVRIFSQASLLAALLPISPYRVVPLIVGSMLILLNSILDARDRHRLLATTRAAVNAERRSGMTQLSADLAENTRLTKESGDKADAAFEAANNLNEKLATVTEAAHLVQGEMRAESTDTNVKVSDLHDELERPEK